MIWQMHDHNEWRFGYMRRGVVRSPYYAEIYFDEDKDPGWIWLVTVPGNYDYIRGACHYFDIAVTESEKELSAHGLLEI